MTIHSDYTQTDIPVTQNDIKKMEEYYKQEPSITSTIMFTGQRFEEIKLTAAAKIAERVKTNPHGGTYEPKRQFAVEAGTILQETDWKTLYWFVYKICKQGNDIPDEATQILYFKEAGLVA